MMSGKIRNGFALIAVSITLSGCMNPIHWWANINHKARDLQSIRSRYEVIEKEYEELRLKHLELEHKFQSVQAELEMERARHQNASITGSAEGRHLANISYSVPETLSMKERYDLALKHVEHKKFQEAFVLFESFLWVPEGAPVQNAAAYYNAGVASFQVKNFNRAREYFEAANTHGDGLKDSETLRRTSLWLKILSKRSDRKIASHE